MSQPGNTELSDYFERKVAGVCTRNGCTSPASDDSFLCLPHLELARASVRRLREKRRRERACVDCGRKVKKKNQRCKACRKFRRRNIDAQERNTEHPSRASRTVEKIEVDALHPDGRIRHRYIGQGKRGRSSKAEESRRDIGEAIKTLERAREGLELLDDPNLSRMDRENKERAVLAQVKLAGRFGDAVLERYE